MGYYTSSVEPPKGEVYMHICIELCAETCPLTWPGFSWAVDTWQLAFVSVGLEARKVGHCMCSSTQPQLTHAMAPPDILPTLYYHPLSFYSQKVSAYYY